MKILLSNDDGIYAATYRALYGALLAAGHEVRAVAPDRERSGASAGITPHTPLMVREVHEPDFDGFATNGTPADSVLLGINGLFEPSWKPDAVITGINVGPNAGMDVLYSGTVGAALQGAICGIPALAVSTMNIRSANRDQAREAVSILERINFDSLPGSLVYNLNFPMQDMDEVKGLKVCPTAAWNPFGRYEERVSPEGRRYWWIKDMAEHVVQDAPGEDRGWLKRGYMTLTPLRFDVTDHLTLDKLSYLEKG